MVKLIACEERMKWKDVFKRHRSVGGISKRAKKVRSLLLTVGPDAYYPNQFDGRPITYYVPMDQSSFLALLETFKERGRISLCSKGFARMNGLKSATLK